MPVSTVAPVRTAVAPLALLTAVVNGETVGAWEEVLCRSWPWTPATLLAHLGGAAKYGEQQADVGVAHVLPPLLDKGDFRVRQVSSHAVHIRRQNHAGRVRHVR